MSEEKQTATKKEKYVDLYIPKGYANEEPNLIIGINGKLYVLPRGEVSKGPPAVKDEFDRSQRASSLFDKKSEKLLEKTKAPINQ